MSTFLLVQFLVCYTALWTTLRCTPLRFKEGRFRIAQFTDLHYGEDEFTPWGPIQDINSDHVMHSVLNAENPDFVLFTGDTLTGNNIDSNATAYWDHVVSPCVCRGTPWAHVLGNHDDLSKHYGDRETLIRHDKSYPQSHTCMGPPYLAGVTNYFLPIYGESSDQVAGIIYSLDSGGGNIPVQVTADQVKWLTETYYTNIQTYGHVPSILAFHIPVPEFEELYNTGSCIGWLNNTIESIPNNGLFETILSLHDILVITTGHYHENDFCCLKNNKLFCQGRHSGYGGYSNVARGSRIMEMKNSTISTWIRMEDRKIQNRITISLNTVF